MEGGDKHNKAQSIMASKGERALTSLVILGFIGYLLYGQNGALVGAIIGGLVGYFWK